MNIIEKILLRLRKRPFVKNYNKYCNRKRGHALFYYKTDVFALESLAEEYIHTNNWEILEISRILNHLGFWVDIVDRHADIATLGIQDKYDLFIGLGGPGQSGRLYPEIAARVPSALKVYYATGMEPRMSNKLARDRYAYFKKRHPDKELQLRKIADEQITEKALSRVDAIFSIGNSVTMQGYTSLGKPLFRLYPSTAPSLSADITQLSDRNPKRFLYFGGGDNIRKGLDIVIEAFQKLPDEELYICAPESETDFYQVYKDVLSSSPNIHFEGFVAVGGKRFSELTATCAYVILPSCSEGTATSVVTCMRRGLIPVVTPEAGIDVEDFGFLVNDITVEGMQETIRSLSKISKDELAIRSVKAYLNSFRYTQASFAESFERALLQTIAL